MRVRADSVDDHIVAAVRLRPAWRSGRRLEVKAHEIGHCGRVHPSIRFVGAMLVDGRPVSKCELQIWHVINVAAVTGAENIRATVLWSDEKKKVDVCFDAFNGPPNDSVQSFSN